MKIHLKNSDYFDGKKQFALKKVAKVGVMFAAAAIAGATFLSTTSPAQPKESSNLESMFHPAIVEVSKEEINDMNIILNDNDCGDAFFEEVCSQLEQDGISFSVTDNNKEINVDNGVIITLDMQYSAGASTLIFAPYDNTRMGDSDSLALSMQAAFQQNGFLVDEILSSKVGFREDEEGNVVHAIPTETEEDISANYDTSFVTISFGTQNVNAEWVAKSIENGLARQKYYLDNYDSSTDLIYRANSGESVQVVADYFGTSVHDLSSANELKSLETLGEQTVVNPNTKDMIVFNSNTQFQIDEVKTRAY